ncbi:MAG: HAMP domain-containing sensor histidine kinase, partial [Pseudomonadota bacterium]
MSVARPAEREAASPRRPVFLSQTRRPEAVREMLIRDGLRDGWIVLAVNMNAAIFFGLAPLTAGYGAAEALIFLGAQIFATSAAIVILLAAMLRRGGEIGLGGARATTAATDLLLAAAWGGSALLFLSPEAFETNILILLLLTAFAVISAAFSARSPKTLGWGRCMLFGPAVLWLAAVEPPYWGLLIGLAVFAAAVSQVVGHAIYAQHLLQADQAIELAEARDKLAERSILLEGALAAARDGRAAAEREADLRERFMQAVTHDLRQPIGALGLYLKEASRRAPEAAEALDPARSCVVSAGAIIDSVSQVALIADGAPRPRIAPTPLAPLFERLEAETRALAAHHGVRLRRAPTSLAVAADAEMLARAVRNLVHNALQYAGGGAVLIGARRRGERVAIEVWDEGPGVPEGERAAIFEPFRRAAADGRRGLGNVGLGLSVVRSFAEAMGGEAALCSVEGRGARFSILLPAACEGPARRAAFEGEALAVDDDPAAAAALAKALRASNPRERSALASAAAAAGSSSTASASPSNAALRAGASYAAGRRM